MTILITRRDYEALPEGTPLELCDGMLVKQPSPRFGHQRIQMRVIAELVRALGVEAVVAGPVDVLIDELNVFVPDIVVLRDVPQDDAQYVGVPLAVFEVLSPSTRDRNRDFKVRRLLGLGVEEVWLVDAQEETIEVVDLEGPRLSRGDRPARSRTLPGVAFVPATLFDRA